MKKNKTYIYLPISNSHLYFRLAAGNDVSKLANNMTILNEWNMNKGDTPAGNFGPYFSGMGPLNRFNIDFITNSENNTVGIPLGLTEAVKDIIKYNKGDYIVFTTIEVNQNNWDYFQGKISEVREGYGGRDNHVTEIPTNYADLGGGMAMIKSNISAKVGADIKIMVIDLTNIDKENITEEEIEQLITQSPWVPYPDIQERYSENDESKLNLY